MNLTSFSSQSILAQKGFTILELAIVIAIIGVVAVLGLPSYQESVRKSHRVDMMTEMSKIGNNIEREKIGYRQYKNIPISAVKLNDYEDYTVAITPTPLSKDWLITATPNSTLMIDDGTLTLDSNSTKCRIIEEQCIPISE